MGQFTAEIWHRRKFRNVTPESTIDHTDPDAFAFNIAQDIARRLRNTQTSIQHVEIVIKDCGESVQS